MIDINRVLNQVLKATQGAQQDPQRGTRAGASVPSVSQRGNGGIPGAELLGGLGSGALGAGALAGVAGLLLGSKKVRKMAGGAIQVGAVAAVGALAYHAYQNYRQGKPVVPKGVTDMIGQVTGQGGGQPAPEPKQIEQWVPQQPERSEEVARLLLKTMVAAAASDGHLDGVEYERIRTQLRGSGLGDDEQLFLSQVIMQRSTPAELAAQATTPELKAEVYAAARLAIDADHADEHKWLDQLAAALQLDPILRTHLDAIGGAERSA